MSTRPLSTSTNLSRLRLARLQAVLSRKAYSEHGLVALIRPPAGQVCHSLNVVSYWIPGSADLQADSAIRFQRSRARGLMDGAVSSPRQVPVGVRDDGLDEVVGDADGVVGVLTGDGLVGLAVEVVLQLQPEFLGQRLLLRREDLQPLDHRRDLDLLARLPADELLDVRVIDVEDDHLRRPPRRPAALDRPGRAVADLEETHQAGGGAAAGEFLAFAADGGEVGAGAGAVLEQARLADPKIHDAALGDEVVVDALDEAVMDEHVVREVLTTLGLD